MSAYPGNQRTLSVLTDYTDPALVTLTQALVPVYTNLQFIREQCGYGYAHPRTRAPPLTVPALISSLCWLSANRHQMQRPRQLGRAWRPRHVHRRGWPEQVRARVHPRDMCARGRLT